MIRRIIRVRSRNNYLGWTFGFLWTIGWISAILLAASLTKDFRIYDHADDQPIQISQPAAGKMIVAVSERELDYTGNFGWLDDNGEQGWDLSRDTLKLSTVRFNVLPSKDSLYYVTMRKYSFGRTEEEAVNRASQIQYFVTSRDSVLDLGSGYSIDKNSKFRGQQVEIEIMIPVGKMIRFDESVKDKLNSADIKVRRSYRRTGGVNIEINDDYWRQFRAGVDYVMGIDGKLRDITGKTVIEENYRYPENDSLRIQQEIESKQRELRELEQLRQNQKRRDTSTSGLRSESMDEADGSMAGTASSVISFVTWF